MNSLEAISDIWSFDGFIIFIIPSLFLERVSQTGSTLNERTILAIRKCYQTYQFPYQSSFILKSVLFGDPLNIGKEKSLTNVGTGNGDLVILVDNFW